MQVYLSRLMLDTEHQRPFEQHAAYINRIDIFCPCPIQREGMLSGVTMKSTMLNTHLKM